MSLPSILVGIAERPWLACTLPLGLSSLSRVFVARAQKTQWLQNLRQPYGNPPPWVFGPVWTILYGLMGYASFRTAQYIKNSTNPRNKAQGMAALRLYYIQLAINLTWPYVYFGMRQKGAALAIIIALTATVYKTTAKMRSLGSGLNTNLCLYPYCAWLTYEATYLNASYVWLNRSLA